MKAPRILDYRADDATDARAQLRAGILAQRAVIAPTYFYDALGARLFAAITQLPEYPLARVEAALIAEHAAQMAHAMRQCAGGGALQLLDLGAADGGKAGTWIAALRPLRYLAVDVALETLALDLSRMQGRFPELEIVGIGIDFHRGLRLPEDTADLPRIALYPGSSIGNFAPDDALVFLGRVRAACPGGGLLVGVDLIKDPAELERAYDDVLGVTAAFNRNVLLHVNRQIGADFDVRDWAHRALYNTGQRRIEMHLEALRACTVRWPGAHRAFGHGERIHTENSYKWDPADFSRLLGAAGFTRIRSWTDPHGGFAVFWAASGDANP